MLFAYLLSYIKHFPHSHKHKLYLYLARAIKYNFQTILNWAIDHNENNHENALEHVNCKL